MAIQQIQKSSTFKPDMIGDLVEVTVYDQSDGTLLTVAGPLDAYSTTPGGTAFVISGIREPQSVPSEGYTLSITHFEYVLDLSEAGDDE